MKKLCINEATHPKAHSVYNHLMIKLNPRIPETAEQMIQYLNKYHGIEVNWLGGSGDKRRTLHENIFNWLFPSMKQQVVFGTGENGLERWGSKKFVADFFLEEEKSVFEIDGSSHKSTRRIMRDLDRSIFFQSIGINVYRITNTEVHNMLVERLIEYEDQGIWDNKSA